MVSAVVQVEHLAVAVCVTNTVEHINRHCKEQQETVNNLN